VSWPAHPDDELIDVTAYGSPGREYARGRSVIGDAIAQARHDYIEGDIDAWEFERQIDRALTSLPQLRPLGAAR
jgi:hypothetical protein